MDRFYVYALAVVGGLCLTYIIGKILGPHLLETIADWIDSHETLSCAISLTVFLGLSAFTYYVAEWPAFFALLMFALPSAVVIYAIVFDPRVDAPPPETEPPPPPPLPEPPKEPTAKERVAEILKRNKR